MPDPGDHYRRTDSDGIVYRVVGRTDDAVTLLRVTDEAGRRVATGEIHHVSLAEIAEQYEPTADPDAGISPVAAVRNLCQGLYWSVRRFL